MPKKQFKEHIVDVIDVDDVSSGERSIEFRAPVGAEGGPHVAVVLPNGGRWADAFVTFRPEISEVSAEFMSWAIDTAKDILYPSHPDSLGDDG